jgi:hypothetical protein
MKLILAYLAACVVGCIVVNVGWLIVVLVGISTSDTLRPSVLWQNSLVLSLLFLVSLILEIPGPHFGLKRWQPLAFLFIIGPLPIILINVSQLNASAIRLAVVGSIMIYSVLGAVYFLSTWVGEKIFSHLDENSP